MALSSTPGEGSAFFVWLPWSASEAAPDEERDRTNSGGQAGGQPVALVIEDNDHAAELIRLQLEPEGFRVARVPTAHAALAWIAEGIPELVILDLLLPDMDGWDLLVQLKHPDCPAARVPVVIVSIVADAQRGIALGAAAVLRKPYARDEMLQALADAGFITARPRSRTLLVDEVHRAIESRETVER